MAEPTFRDWLAGELDRRQMKRRELARRLAAQHPEGVTLSTIETYRRAIYKYLDPAEPTTPTETTRRAFAKAFGIDPDDIPAGDDDEAEPDMAATLMAVTRELRRLQRQLRTAGIPA